MMIAFSTCKQTIMKKKNLFIEFLSVWLFFSFRVTIFGLTIKIRIKFVYPNEIYAGIQCPLYFLMASL